MIRTNEKLKLNILTTHVNTQDTRNQNEHRWPIDIDEMSNEYEKVG